MDFKKKCNNGKWFRWSVLTEVFLLLLFAILWLRPWRALAFDNLDYGVPKTAETVIIIDREGYACGYSPRMKQPLWVSYRLTSEESSAVSQIRRADDFREDLLLAPSIRATLGDYRDSGYDRGHLAPAADMAWSTNAMSESFYLSNMSPQKPNFNRGVWKDLESRSREMARRERSVYVWVGPVFGESIVTNYIGNSRIRVPTGFFRVLLDESEPRRIIAYLISQDAPRGDLWQYTNSVETIEQVTGLYLPIDKERINR